MKSLFKVTLLALALGSTQVMAEEATVEPTESVKAADAKFKNENEKIAYALGSSFWRYMDNILKEQEKLGVKIDRNTLLTGFQETANNKGKLSNEEVDTTLQEFSAKEEKKAKEKLEKEAKENADKGVKFGEKFSKEAGVKKTKSGLMYKVEKEGKGDALKDTDTVVVNYKGALIDGKEFDNSYTRGEPLTFRLDGVITGWSEGLKKIRKGGKVKLVIPPQLAYGESGAPGSIPPNSTLVFDVELLDVNPQPKKEDAPAKAEKAK